MPKEDAGERSLATQPLTIGFINNLGPSGVEAAERQFFGLVRSGAGDRPVDFCCFSLVGPQPAAAARALPGQRYLVADEIPSSGLDAVIVTGAEPRNPELSDEPYWDRLTAVLDWARETRVPVLLSCLAAHAAILHRDGIRRRRLPQKCSGLMRERVVRGHPLTLGLPDLVMFPHSRWNDVGADVLEASGYAVLTRTLEGAADCFAKDDGNLVVGFQGHPEYEPQTLLLEYRRDVGRYLAGIAEHYPGLPASYFSPAETETLMEFQNRAQGDRHPELFSEFPIEPGRAAFAAPWRDQAAQLFRNWLALVRDRAAIAPELAARG